MSKRTRSLDTDSQTGDSEKKRRDGDSAVEEREVRIVTSSKKSWRNDGGGDGAVAEDGRSKHHRDTSRGGDGKDRKSKDEARDKERDKRDKDRDGRDKVRDKKERDRGKDRDKEKDNRRDNDRDRARESGRRNEGRDRSRDRKRDDSGRARNRDKDRDNNDRDRNESEANDGRRKGANEAGKSARRASDGDSSKGKREDAKARRKTIGGWAEASMDMAAEAQQEFTEKDAYREQMESLKREKGKPKTNPFGARPRRDSEDSFNRESDEDWNRDDGWNDRGDWREFDGRRFRRGGRGRGGGFRGRGRGGGGAGGGLASRVESEELERAKEVYEDAAHEWDRHVAETNDYDETHPVYVTMMTAHKEMMRIKQSLQDEKFFGRGRGFRGFRGDRGRGWGRGRGDWRGDWRGGRARGWGRGRGDRGGFRRFDNRGGRHFSGQDDASRSSSRSEEDGAGEKGENDAGMRNQKQGGKSKPVKVGIGRNVFDDEDVQEENQNKKGKWKMCQFFLEGYCKFGDNCNFLHHPEESDTKNDNKRRKEDEVEPEFHPPADYTPTEKPPAPSVPASNKLSFVPSIDYYIPQINADENSAPFINSDEQWKKLKETVRRQTYYLLREVYSESVKTIIAVESEQCEYSLKENKVYFVGFQSSHHRIPGVIEYTTEVERLSKIKGLINDDCGIPIDSIEELFCESLNLDKRDHKEEKKEDEATDEQKDNKPDETWSHYELKLESDANYLEALKHDHVVPMITHDLCSMIVHWPEAHFKYVDKQVEKSWIDGLKKNFTQMGSIGCFVQKRDHRAKRDAIVHAEYLPEPVCLFVTFVFPEIIDFLCDMKMEYGHLPFTCQRIRATQESLNEVLERGLPMLVSPLYLPKKRILKSFDYKNVKGPGNLAREHLGLKVDAKELDDQSSLIFVPPVAKPPVVKEEFPKQIQEVMVCSQQAHDEWVKAGKPPTPHPTFLSKAEIGKILKSMIDQYLQFKAKQSDLGPDGKKKRKSRWESNEVSFVPNNSVTETTNFPNDGPVSANPMGHRVAKPQAFVTKAPVTASAQMSSDQFDVDEQDISYLEATYVDDKPLFFEDVMDYFSNFGEIKWCTHSSTNALGVAFTFSDTNLSKTVLRYEHRIHDTSISLRAMDKNWEEIFPINSSMVSNENFEEHAFQEVGDSRQSYESILPPKETLQSPSMSALPNNIDSYNMPSIESLRKIISDVERVNQNLKIDVKPSKKSEFPQSYNDFSMSETESAALPQEKEAGEWEAQEEVNEDFFDMELMSKIRQHWHHAGKTATIDASTSNNYRENVNETRSYEDRRRVADHTSAFFEKPSEASSDDPDDNEDDKEFEKYLSASKDLDEDDDFEDEEQDAAFAAYLKNFQSNSRDTKDSLDERKPNDSYHQKQNLETRSFYSESNYRADHSSNSKDETAQTYQTHQHHDLKRRRFSGNYDDFGSYSISESNRYSGQASNRYHRHQNNPDDSWHREETSPTNARHFNEDAQRHINQDRAMYRREKNRESFEEVPNNEYHRF